MEGQILQEQESKEWSQAAEVCVGVHGEKVSHGHLNHLYVVDFIKTGSCFPANQVMVCALTSSCAHLLFRLHQAALSSAYLTRWMASLSRSSCCSYSHPPITPLPKYSRSSKQDPGFSCPVSVLNHPTLSPQKQQLHAVTSEWQQVFFYFTERD